MQQNHITTSENHHIIHTQALVHTFHFHHANARGQYILLENNPFLLKDHGFNICELLSQLMTGLALLVQQFKFEGKVFAMIKPQDTAFPLQSLMAEMDHVGHLRGSAKLKKMENEEQNNNDNVINTIDIINPTTPTKIINTLPDSILTITIEQTNQDPWQAMTEIKAGQSLADAFSIYLQQSAQIPTLLVLQNKLAESVCHHEQAFFNNKSVGLLVQKMPQEGGKETLETIQNWQTVEALMATVKENELLEKTPETMLYHLFSDIGLTETSTKDLYFQCTCSQDKAKQIIKMIGQEEIEDILEEEQLITIRCEYCSESYQFNHDQSMILFAENYTHEIQ